MGLALGSWEKLPCSNQRAHDWVKSFLGTAYFMEQFLGPQLPGKTQGPTSHDETPFSVGTHLSLSHDLIYPTSFTMVEQVQ